MKHNVAPDQQGDFSPIAVPASTPGGFAIKFLNDNPDRGPVVTLFLAKAGTKIPAHAHANFAETHYVLDGDFIDDGITFGPGSFLSHSPGTRHGPHETKTGYTLITTQTKVLDVGDSGDFEVLD